MPANLSTSEAEIAPTSEITEDFMNRIFAVIVLLASVIWELHCMALPRQPLGYNERNPTVESKLLHGDEILIRNYLKALMC